MQTSTLFGTDGIRGRANSEPMTAETALRVAMAAGRHFQNGQHRHVALIGKDTRLSGYMLEPALVAGLVSVGVDVVLVGPLPTPAIAMLTRSMRADLGVMISASHNLFEDNGIKLFGPDGYKLSDEDEQAIERIVLAPRDLPLVPASALGRARRLDDAPGRYIELVKNSFPRGLRLDGLKIALDCAHGAAYKVAPTVLWELGAEVITIGASPNGVNINDGCGATDVTALVAQLRQSGADVGLALDGDADRLIMVDERGCIIDGDQIMGLIGSDWQRSGLLAGGGLVATVMSNLGLERYLHGLGLKLVRTAVGDRHVVAAMRAGGYNLGGEQSGHVVLSDYGTTGDGLIAGLQFLACVIRSGKPASAVARVFEPLPQILRSFCYHRSCDPLAASSVQAAIGEAERRLCGTGRLLVRKSGTEPVVRVMCEGEDFQLVERIVNQIAEEIEGVRGG